MSRDSRRLLAPAALGVLTVALAGCGGGGGTSAATSGSTPALTAPSVAVTKDLATARGLSLPISAYMPTAAQRQVIDNATQELIRRCMVQFGFAWQASSVSAKQPSLTYRRYGVEPDTAATLGYHPDLRVLGGGPTDKAKLAAQAGQTYSPTEMLVLGGETSAGGTGTGTTAGTYRGRQIPPGGCGGEARRTLNGTDQIDDSVTDKINFDMYSRSTGDPRVVAAFKAWSACMKRSGYNYAGPMAPGDAFAAASSAPPTQVEIRTAVTDVACKRSTNVVGIWYAVEVGYEKQAIQQQIERLTAVKAQWDAAARKAAQLLGVPAPAAS
jgi:hypothetical protein